MNDKEQPALTVTAADKKPQPATPKLVWKPYEKGIVKNSVGAETACSAKFAGVTEPIKIVSNQFGQLLDASTRRLIDVAPTEVLIPG